MDLSKVTLDIFSKLEQKWLYCDVKKIRVLSIDGGGTTAIIAGAALLHLEEQIQAKSGDSNARIADYFDIVAGTGIGALFAAMLTADDGNNRPLYTAKDAVDFVNKKKGELYKTQNVGVLRRKKMWSTKSMDKVLKEAFSREDGKVITLKDTCKPLLIPCFDLNTSAPFVFSRADATESDSYDFELWKVCRATSATPSMVKPFALTSVDGKTACLGLDGGLVMNNPTAAAVIHVLNNKREFPTVGGVEDLLVLSLSNGLLSSPLLPKRDCIFRTKCSNSLNNELNNSPLSRAFCAKCSNSLSNGLKNSLLGRAFRVKCTTSSVIDIVLDGVSETIDQMLGNAFCWNKKDYVRIQGQNCGRGGVGERAEDVLKEKGVESLPFGGKRILTETNGERIGSFVQRLVASGRSSLPPSPCKDTTVNLLINSC